MDFSTTGRSLKKHKTTEQLLEELAERAKKLPADRQEELEQLLEGGDDE